MPLRVIGTCAQAVGRAITPEGPWTFAMIDQRSTPPSLVPGLSRTTRGVPDDGTEYAARLTYYGPMGPASQAILVCGTGKSRETEDCRK